MAITLNKIETMLKDMGINGIKQDESGQQLTYGVKGENIFFHHVVLQENGELFQIYARQLIDSDEIVDHPHKPLVAGYLLKKAYDYKFGTMEMDDDGEIRIGVEIPLEDNTLTERQFQRIYGLLTKNIDTMISEIRQILETGELPTSEETDPRVALRAMIASNPAQARQIMDDPDTPAPLKEMIRDLLGVPTDAETQLRQIQEALARGDFETAQKIIATRRSETVPDSI